MSITKVEALKRIAALHEEFALKHGDTAPYVGPEKGPTDAAEFNADLGAPAAAQDELNRKIMAILDQVAR